MMQNEPQKSMVFHPGCFRVIGIFLFVWLSCVVHGQTFNYTGSVQSYTMPDDGCLTLKSWGAGGGDGGADNGNNGGTGGAAAYAEITLPVQAGDVLDIYVGGPGIDGASSSGGGSGPGGWGYGNGGPGGNAGTQGGSGGGGGGGGSSTVVLNGTVVLVSGGGGGGGGAGCSNVGGNGGGAGQDGQSASPPGDGGIAGASGNANGTQGDDRGNGDGAGGGGGGGGWDGGTGGGTTAQGGSDCGYGGGAGGGGGGNSLGNIVINATGTTPGNSGDPDLCAGCAIPGGDGVVVFNFFTISANISTTDETTQGACDGTASSSPTGGATPYTYQWSNGNTTSSISGMCPGSYDITVTDANGCNSVDNFIIYPAWCVSNVDFNTWIQEGDPVDGDWMVCCGGSEVDQSINGNPTFYVSPDTFINVIIQGVIEVTTTSDDDFIGFVFGYLNPTGTPYDNYNTWLFDWKETAQTASGFFADEGMTLNHIEGTIPNADRWEYFWGHTNNPPLFDVVGTNYGAGTGWADFTAYQFTLVYTTTRTIIMVDSDTIFDLAGCFEPGRFGFYNFSQSDVKYSNFQYQLMNDFQMLTPEVCVDDTARFMFIDTAACTGIPSNMESWEWDFGDGNNSTDLNPVHVYDASGTYPVTLLVTDYLGCQDIVSKNIVVNSLPQPNAANTPVTCNNGSDGTVTTAVSGGTSPLIYQWNNGQSTAAVTGLIAGVYTVTISDDKGCSLSESTTILEPTAITLTTTTDSVTCNGGSDGSATVNASGGITPYTYQWDANAGGSTSSFVAGLSANTYQVTVTDANGCTATASAIVEEPTLLTIPGAGFSAIMATCPGFCDGEAVVLPQGGITPYSYNWSPAPGAGQGTFYATGFCAGNYTIEVTDANGCTATNPFTITDPDALTIDTAITPSSCGQNDGSIAVSNVSGGTSPYTYLWDSSTDNQTTSTAGSLVGGVYTLTVTDDNQCEYDFAFAVDSVPGPDISVTGTNTTCYADCDGTASISFNVSGTTPYTYGWSNNSNTQNTTGLCAGAYSVTVTDDNGCEDIASITITEPSKVSVTLSPSTDPIICRGTSTILEATASGGNGSPYSYEWNAQPGASTNTVSPSSPTTYDVIATDAMGCQSDTEQIFVDLYDPLSVIVFNDQTICRGGSASLNVVASGGNGNYTYIWSDGTTTSSASVNKNPASYPNATTYTVTVTDNCTTPEAVGSVTIDYHPVPQASFVVDASEGCAPHTVTFANTSPQSIACSWNMDDGSNAVSGCSTFSYEFYQSGTYDVSLTVFSNKLCESDPFTDQIVVHPNPVADFHIDNQPTTTLNTFIRFKDMTISAEAIDTWSWTFFGNDGITPIGASQDQNPSYEYPADTGTYPVYLEVTTINNCVDDTTLYPFIDAHFTFYTPNGDGLNDYFFPKGIGINDKKFSFMIFDRWGNMIFESASQNDPWDGTSRKSGGTKLVQNGVYIWKVVVVDIKREPQRHFYTGHVTLLR